MKRLVKVLDFLVVMILILAIFPIFSMQSVYASSISVGSNNDDRSSESNASASNEETIKEQQEEFGIQDFLKNSEQYMGEFFADTDMDMKKILDDAIQGEIDHSSFGKRVLSLLGSEVVSSLKAIGSILVIIVIHSVLKAISESLKDDGISKLIYYVQYILIVTIVMASFSDIVKMVQDTTTNLVAFMNMLIPLLITLMMSTGSIATSGVIEPIILFMINFIGNMIQDILIPCLMVFTALVVLSKLSDQIKIDKLSKFLNSGIVWFLGIILTVFVGVVSLEGTMASSVDRNYSENDEGSCQFSNSSSRKDIRRCCGYSSWLWSCLKKCSRISWCCDYFRNLYCANYQARNADFSL